MKSSFYNISISIYRSINKNKIVPGRNRTFDDRLTADNFTIKLQGQKKMREAGFEPAHPEIRRLKRRDINRASRFARTS